MYKENWTNIYLKTNYEFSEQKYLIIMYKKNVFLGVLIKNKWFASYWFVSWSNGSNSCSVIDPLLPSYFRPLILTQLRPLFFLPPFSSLPKFLKRKKKNCQVIECFLDFVIQLLFLKLIWFLQVCCSGPVFLGCGLEQYWISLDSQQKWPYIATPWFGLETSARVTLGLDCLKMVLNI